MTTMTASNVQPEQAAADVEPINLYKLGMLFVVKCRYWTCRAGNDAQELDLTADRIEAKALASFGSKDLLDPDKTRKVFQHLEKRARHTLEKHSRLFAAANAHFVPWNSIETVIEELESLKVEFNEAVNQFIADYILSGHAYLHVPTTEKSRFQSELKAIADTAVHDRQVFT